MLAGIALAAGICALPAQLPAPYPELPSAEQPTRNLPATGYSLALSWAPEFCREGHEKRPGDFECDTAAERGRFVLHGLWPDGNGPERWPQYCRPAAVLDTATLKRGLCDSPSVQLLQHEWAKHGTCTAAPDARSYFATEDKLFEHVRVPDMAALAGRTDLTAAAFQSAFAAANPGMTPDMMRLNVGADGALKEVWLCLGLDHRTRACPAGQGGAAPDRAVRVLAPG